MTSTQWFLFDSAERNSYWSALEDPVEDDEGDYLPHAQNKSTKFWMSVRTKTLAPDLFRAPGSFFVFSETAKRIVADFRLPQNAGWKPVEIRYTSGLIGNHHCLMLPRDYDVLNRELSDFDWLVPGIAVGTVRKWVLKRDALPDLDLFNAECQNWICSKRLADAIRAAGVTAISLVPVETD